MTSIRMICLAAALGAVAWFAASAASEDPTSRPKGGKAEARREHERQFKEMLENNVLKGSWQMTGEAGLAGKAPLSEGKPETYTLGKVSKASDDYWIINARVQYAEKDVSIPVTVRVTWAEDTPIITLDKMALPGLGTYSARVMIYRGFYAGTWFGTNYGGVLSGQIVKPETEKSTTSQPAD